MIFVSYSSMFMHSQRRNCIELQSFSILNEILTSNRFHYFIILLFEYVHILITIHVFQYMYSMIRMECQIYNLKNYLSLVRGKESCNDSRGSFSTIEYNCRRLLYMCATIQRYTAYPRPSLQLSQLDYVQFLIFIRADPKYYCTHVALKIPPVGITSYQRHSSNKQ